MLNSSLSPNKDSSGQNHPRLDDIENSVCIINGINQVAVMPIGEGEPPLQVVPSSYGTRFRAQERAAWTARGHRS
jgi:hypothetical protein